MSDSLAHIRAARRSVPAMASLSAEAKDRALEAMASALDARRTEVLAANAEDVLEYEGRIPLQMLKRLRVDGAKIDEMVASIRSVGSLPDPVGETLSALEMDEGLRVYKVRCPIGLIGIVFEARPDVVPQVMSLCLKSGNAVALKGGSEAKRSNRALFSILRSAVASAGVPAEAFALMESREDVAVMLGMDGDIDLIIPRGSYSFVRHIQDSTRIPVLGHSAGICGVYVDGAADLGKAYAVALDSKIQYPAACNAMENLLVDRSVLRGFLPRMAEIFRENGVEVRADAECMGVLGGEGAAPATEEDWDSEYGDLTVSVKAVGGLDEAIDFINAHGSHHTDCIVTEDEARAGEFVRRVDSADVMINASTRFADGFRIGLGAEVGISTGKIHARGPMGMEGLTIYKYVVVGRGQRVADYSGPGGRKYVHRELGEVCRYGKPRGASRQRRARRHQGGHIVDHAGGRRPIRRLHGLDGGAGGATLVRGEGGPPRHLRCGGYRAERDGREAEAQRGPHQAGGGVDRPGPADAEVERQLPEARPDGRADSHYHGRLLRQGDRAQPQQYDRDTPRVQGGADLQRERRHLREGDRRGVRRQRYPLRRHREPGGR